MIQDHLLSILIIIFLAGFLIYRASFLKNRRLFKLTLHQILYFFVIPSISSILVFNYALDLTKLPKNPNYFLRDGLLLNLVFVSMLFAYAGKAIHIVTTALFDAGLKTDSTPAGKINQKFHSTFSHNFVLGGLILLVTSLTLLEMNHLVDYSYNSLFSPMLRGFGIGLALIGGMYNYTRPDFKEDYPGVAWSDLKIVFSMSWVAFILIFFLSQLAGVQLNQYQLLLPALFALASVNVLNIFLTSRSKKS